MIYLQTVQLFRTVKSSICERLQHKIKNKEDPNGRF